MPKSFFKLSTQFFLNSLLGILFFSIFFFVGNSFVNATFPFWDNGVGGNACLIGPTTGPLGVQHLDANGNNTYYGRMFLLTNPANPNGNADYVLIDGSEPPMYQNVFNCGVNMNISADPGYFVTDNRKNNGTILTSALPVITSGPGTISGATNNSDGAVFNWNIPTSIANGTTGSITYTIMPDGGGMGQNCTWTFNYIVSCQTDLGISKTQITPQSNMYVGNQATFRIIAHNYGPGLAATPVVISDTLPSGLTFNSYTNATSGLVCTNSGQNITCTYNSDLANGAEISVDIVTNITSVINGSNQTANVTSSSDEPAPDPHPNNVTILVTTFNPVSDLSVTKTLSSGTLVVGNNVTYNLAIKNNGPQDANGATITDNLPVGYSYVSFSNANYSCSASAYSPSINQTVTCTRTGTLTNGSTDNLTLTLHINPEAAWVSATPVTNIQNTACVATISPNVDNTSANNCSTIPTSTQNKSDLTATKVIAGNPTTIVPGGAITYDITVTNTGPGADNNIQFSDPLSSYLTNVTATCSIQTPGTISSAPWSESCGTPTVSTSAVTATAALKVGGVAIYHIYATVDPNINPASCPYIPNSLTATPSSGTAGTSNANIQIIPNNNLVITNSNLQPNPLVAGQSFNFSLNIQNTGSTFTNGVAKINLVDQNGTPNTDVFGLSTNCSPFSSIACNSLSYSYDSTDNGTTTFGVGTKIGALQMSATSNGQILTSGNLSSTQNFQSLYYTAQVTLPVCGGTVNKCFDCTTNSLIDVPPSGQCPVCQPQNCTGSNCVQSVADLELTKVASVTQFVAGQTASYTLTLTNKGPSVSLGPITIKDTLPTDLELSSGTWYTSSSNLFNCGYNATTREITCTRNTTMTVNEVSNVVLYVIVLASTKSASITNSAVAKGTTSECAIPQGSTSCIDPYKNDPKTTTPVLRSADVAIFKTHTGSNKTGGSGTFNLNIKNLGPSTAQGVVVSDLVPSNLQIMSIVPAQNWTCTQDANNITNNVSCSYDGDLVVGYSDIIQVNYKILSNASGQIINTAEVTTTDPDPDKTNNKSSDDLNVTREADLSIVKTHEGGTSVGSTGNYNLNIKNSGPATAKGVVVTDNFPASLELVSIDTPPNWTCVNSSSVITCSFGIEMPVDYSAIIKLNYKVASGATGKILNTTSIKSDDTDPDNTNNNSTDTLNVVLLPKTSVDSTLLFELIVIFLITVAISTYYLPIQLKKLNTKRDLKYNFEEKLGR